MVIVFGMFGGGFISSVLGFGFVVISLDVGYNGS